jgi:HEPN domain-containing protein
MNELTAEWGAKAEGDFATAGRELRARKRPNYDAACFHAQQTAEKYLKAFLQEHRNLGFPTLSYRDSSKNRRSTVVSMPLRKPRNSCAGLCGISTIRFS